MATRPVSTGIVKKFARIPAAAGDLPTHRARTTVLIVSLCTVTSVLAWIVLGMAAALVLGSAWLLAAGIGRALPGLRGPASWAAAVVAEFALLLGTSACVVFLSPHLHSRSVNLVIVVVPAVFGGALWLVSARLSRTDDQNRLPSRWGLALSITTGALAVAGWISSRGPYYGIAWAMSGDARNHVAITRVILSDGGVTVNALKAYPAAVNGVVAVVAGVGDRSGAAGQVIVNDVHAIAAIYVLSGMSIGLLLAGALIEILPRAVRNRRRLAPSVVATVLIAAAVGGSAFVLGLALTDGFLSAYGALPVAIAAVVLALRFFVEIRCRLAALTLMAVATILTFVSWTLLVIVPGSLLLVTSATALIALVHSPSRRKGTQGRARLLLSWGVIACALATLAVLTAVVVSAWPRLVSTFVLTGSTSTPYEFMLVVLGSAALGTALAVGRWSTRRQMLVPLTVSAAGAIVVFWLLHLSAATAVWSYYALKSNWLFSASLLWVPFAPIVLWIARDREPAGIRQREGLSNTLSAICFGTVSLLLIGSATTAPRVLLAASHGWNQPSAEVVGQAIRGADAGTGFVFWEWSDFGNDRLGNFWSALDTELPGVPGGFANWSYTYTGKTSELCTLVAGAPGITIYTRSKSLSSDLHDSCPAVPARIVTSG